MNGERKSKKAQTLLNQFGNGASLEEPADSIREPFEEARPRSREDIMLDVRFSTGSRSAFNYAYLVKVCYEPGDTLRLLFGTYTVRIEGRHLLRLYETLTQHRTRYVQEGSAAEDGLKAEDSPHIESISIEEGDESE